VDEDRVEGKAKQVEGEVQEGWGEAKDKARDAWDDAKDKLDGDDEDDLWQRDEEKGEERK
jgi:hypothetical protein